MNRRVLTLVVALVPILAFGLLVSVVTVPFVGLGPGPTFNTLGDSEGKQVVDIQGTTVHPTSGHLNMTTVSQSDGLTLGQALRLWMSGNEQLIPRDLVYPPDKSKDQIDQANTSDFKQSEDSAEYAALSYLKYPEAVTVENVTDPGPSTGKLQDGDAIDMVDNKPVAKLAEFTAILKATKPGDQLVVDYRRKNVSADVTPGQVVTVPVNPPPPGSNVVRSGDTMTAMAQKSGVALAALEAANPQIKDPNVIFPGQVLVIPTTVVTHVVHRTTITLGHNPDRDYGFLGVAVQDAPWAPFTIDFNLANIGGPSAGLMFSLAVVDKLTTGDLNGGKFVAGTGTITGDGKVGPIGGITHKMYAAREAGATVFMVPAENCDEAKSAHDEDLQLIKVDDLTGAIDALKTYSAGGEPAHC